MLEEGQKALNDYLNRNYGGWRKTVRDGVEKGLNFAIEALKVAKETVVQRCRENKELLQQLTKFAVKTTAREIVAKTAVKVVLREAAKVGTKTAAKTAAKVGTKTAAKTAAKVGTKTAAKTAAKVGTKTAAKTAAKVGTKTAAKTAAKAGTKSFIKTAANPVGIISDLAQGGLEYAGYKEEGKTVGVCGNIASGAMIGGVAAGPPGAAVGALAGFGVWVAGEAVGVVVDWMFD